MVLEKAEEPEIKLPTTTGSLKKQESSRKISTSALLTTPKPLTMWITTNCGKFFKRWEYQMETMPGFFFFLDSKITADGDCSHEIKTLAAWKKSYDQPRQLIKKRRHYFANKSPSSQFYGFSSSHVWM